MVQNKTILPHLRHNIISYFDRYKVTEIKISLAALDKFNAESNSIFLILKKVY